MQSRLARITIIIAAIAPALRAQVRYTLTDLGNLGSDFGDARAISPTGQVAGYAGTPVLNPLTGSSPHAFYYSHGTIQDLGTLGGVQSVADGVNAAGQVVGSSFIDAPGNSHAFLYENGHMTDLGALGGNESNASAINASGQIVGDAWTANNAADHAFLWQSGSMQDLGTLGGAGSVAFALNSSATTVGESEIPAVDSDGDPIYHAFVYQNQTMTDLGTLGGPGSVARAINDRGQIVGDAQTSFLGETGSYELVPDGQGGYQSVPVIGPITHAFLYQNGAMTDLGTLGGNYSSATGINSSGQIIGNSDAGPFIWEDGVMTDLNSLIAAGSGWSLRYAEAINDAGQIVGDAISPDGSDHAFLLTPLPDPAAFPLLLLPATLLLRRPRLSRF
jgi:probable HAF family extracellular repeat protein